MDGMNCLYYGNERFEELRGMNGWLLGVGLCFTIPRRGVEEERYIWEGGGSVLLINWQQGDVWAQ